MVLACIALLTAVAEPDLCKDDLVEEREEKLAVVASPMDLSPRPHAARVVAACESGRRLADGTAEVGSHDWRNVNSQGSTASGAFQFLDGTWQWVASEIGATEYARAKHAPPEVQVRAFDWLWEHGGPQHWNPSRSCWSRMM